MEKDARGSFRLPPDDGTGEVRWDEPICLWSPTGDHFFQLVEAEVPGRRGPVLRDRCQHCNTSAFSKRVRPQGAQLRDS